MSLRGIFTGHDSAKRQHWLRAPNLFNLFSLLSRITCFLLLFASFQHVLSKYHVVYAT